MGANEAFGDISETFIYNTSTLSATDTQKINSYMAIKYGVTLDQTTAQNYILSNTGIVWNGTTNSGYKNNIFGIARDDGSALDQRVSNSVNASGIIAFANGTTFSATQASNTAFASNLSAEIFGDDNGSTGFSLT